MVHGESLASLRRGWSFFAARGTANTLTYGRWRVKRLLQRCKPARSYDVDTDELVRSLEPTSVTEAENRESWLLGLTSHFRSRPSPLLYESDSARTIERVPAEQKERTIRSAELICQNVFELRAAGPVRFDGRIDWTYCPGGNIDWRWDLNRHAFFETLGRAYAYTRDG